MQMTVTLGDVMQIVGTLGAIFLAYQGIRDRLTRIETRLDPLWREFIGRRGAGGDDEE